MTDLTTETLPDGSTRICLRGVCGTVSSAHLVDVKVRQLERLVKEPRLSSQRM